MGWVDIYTDAFTFNFTETNPLATKPVTMMKLMNITIQWPLVEKYVLNYVSWKYTYSRTKHTTVNLKLN
jgi:hypothetical protein